MDIIESKRVRQYELTYLLSGSLTTSEAQKVKDEVAKLLKKHKIEVISSEDWGKKSLAYPIKYKSKKQYEGYYTYMVLETESKNVVDFEKELYLNHDVIRHLLVLAEGEVSSIEELKAE